MYIHIYNAHRSTYLKPPLLGMQGLSSPFAEIRGFNLNVPTFGRTRPLTESTPRTVHDYFLKP